jgi:hypothetical protein
MRYIIVRITTNPNGRSVNERAEWKPDPDNRLWTNWCRICNMKLSTTQRIHYNQTCGYLGARDAR